MAGVGLTLIGVVLAGTVEPLPADSPSRWAVTAGDTSVRTATTRGGDAVPQHEPLSSIETQQWVLLLALGLFATAIPFTSS